MERNIMYLLAKLRRFAFLFLGETSSFVRHNMGVLVFDIIFRFLALQLHVIRFAYWVVSERKSHAAKKKLRAPSLGQIFERVPPLAVGGLVGIELLGWPLWPMPYSLLVQAFGFFVTVLGFVVSMLARYELGNNWSHAAEFQIKDEQQLVTTGIYRHIRHPIYTGMILALGGAMIVAQSYSFVPYFFIAGIFAYWQARREETILLKHFGLAYKKYMHQSARFLPWVF